MTRRRPRLPVEERTRVLLTILRLHQSETISLGETIRVLRAHHLGLSQRTFASAVRVSTPTLALIETDAANPGLDTLNAILRPFGLQVGIMPRVQTGLLQSSIDLTDDQFQTLSTEVLAGIARNRRTKRGRKATTPEPGS
jgi:DNA-binding XRE family transcriptional regulator